jgi:acetoin utilization protein AcuB
LLRVSHPKNLDVWDIDESHDLIHSDFMTARGHKFIYNNLVKIFTSRGSSRFRTLEVKMFVGERMSRPVISVSPETPVNETLAMFKKERIRRAPVMKNGKLLGIVSERDLLNASPSPVTSLSIWELHYLVSKVTVRQVMSKKVITVNRDTPIEEAARIMADNKIGGVPVMDAGKVVGIITETDLFKVFLELMGARQKALRVTAQVEDQPGVLAKLTKAISENGGNFLAFGMFAGPDANSKTVTFKVEGIKKEEIKKVLGGAVIKYWDIRQS